MRKIITHYFLLGILLLLGNAAIAQVGNPCIPTYSSACSSGDYIQSFSTTGGTTNITNNNTGCPGPNYTYYNTMTHTAIQGTQVNWSFTNCPNWPQGYKIWVDWNNNGNFLDAGDQMYASAATIPGGGVVTGNFIIPFTATPGQKRLRIRCVYSSTVFDPCDNQSFGETEDYNLMVVAATPCTGQPTAGVASVGGSCPTIISLTGTTLAGDIVVQWQKRVCGSTWADIPGANNYSYPVASQTQPTEYRAYVLCTPSGMSDTSNIVNITNVVACYCSSSASFTADEEIFSVTLNGVTNTLACGVAAPGPGSVPYLYSNFTTLGPLTTLSPGATVPFTIVQDECDGATYYSNGVAMWIDFNNDGDYLDAGEKVYGETTTSTGPRTINGTFVVPANAATGVITGMRVMVVESNASPTSCQNYNYGETEDYLVKIAYVPTVTGGGVYCQGDSVVLVATAPGLSNPVFSWTGPNG